MTGKSTVLSEPYREAFAALRYAIDSEHVVGSAAHERLHDCVDALSQLIANGVAAVVNVQIQDEE